MSNKQLQLKLGYLELFLCYGKRVPRPHSLHSTPFRAYIKREQPPSFPRRGELEGDLTLLPSRCTAGFLSLTAPARDAPEPTRTSTSASRPGLPGRLSPSPGPARSRPGHGSTRTPSRTRSCSLPGSPPQSKPQLELSKKVKPAHECLQQGKAAQSLPEVPKATPGSGAAPSRFPCQEQEHPHPCPCSPQALGSIPTPLCPPSTTGQDQIWLKTQVCCVPPAVQQHPPPLAQLGRDGDRDPSRTSRTRQEPLPRSPGHPAQTGPSKGSAAAAPPAVGWAEHKLRRCSQQLSPRSRCGDSAEMVSTCFLVHKINSLGQEPIFC